MNHQNNSAQAQLVAQWITSLAISVICCAVLFIVFAGYIVQLHNTTNLTSVRLEVLQERHNQLVSEMMALKRAPVVQIAPQPAQPTQVVPPATGVEINEPAPAEPAKGENNFAPMTAPAPAPGAEPSPAVSAPAAPQPAPAPAKPARQPK